MLCRIKHGIVIVGTSDAAELYVAGYIISYYISGKRRSEHLVSFFPVNLRYKVYTARIRGKNNLLRNFGIAGNICVLAYGSRTVCIKFGIGKSCAVMSKIACKNIEIPRVAVIFVYFKYI